MAIRIAGKLERHVRAGDAATLGAQSEIFNISALIMPSPLPPSLSPLRFAALRQRVAANGELILPLQFIKRAFCPVNFSASPLQRRRSSMVAP